MPPSEPTTSELVPDPAPTDGPPPVVLPVARPVERDFEHVYEDEFDFDDTPRKPCRMALYVRLMLAGMALGFTAVLLTALCLDPYEKADDGAYVVAEDGSRVAKTQETHRQLGLPRCSSMEWYGKPCPACGMTTSFALLTEGDVVNSLKANWVGTLLCATLIVLTPWLLACAIRGRLVWVRNGELFSTIILSSLLLLMTGRWAWIMFVN